MRLSIILIFMFLRSQLNTIAQLLNIEFEQQDDSLIVHSCGPLGLCPG